MLGLKLSVIAVWLCLTLSGFLFAIADGRETYAPAAAANSYLPSVRPDQDSVDSYNELIQMRFLAEPRFGMARMPPPPGTPLKSIHFASGGGRYEQEADLVNAWVEQGYAVGLYLFGRRVEMDPKRRDRVKIKYRVNQPIPISHNVRAEKLPNAKKLVNEIRSAFFKFQQATDAASERHDFSIGNWAFQARPVRAMNESCVTCHTDPVITAQMSKKEYKIRKREVGDVNGIVVYAFSKDDKNKNRVR